MTTQIPPDQINFHSTSFCDGRGRVFWWNKELYRGIQQEYAAFYEQLFQDGIIQELIEKKLIVKTELTHFNLPNYPLIIKHQCLPFVSYANEWCPEMLKDAAQLILNLMTELGVNNLILSDSCSWDILFDNYHPIFVDFPTIQANQKDTDRVWQGKVFTNSFRSYFIYPLSLMAQGYGTLARYLSADYQHDLILTEFASLMKYENSTIEFMKSVFSKLTGKKPLYGVELVPQLQKELDQIILPSIRLEKKDSLSFETSNNWTAKRHYVHKLLSELSPGTVLDVGCGEGWYSQLAASLGNQVIAVDIDDRKVAYCYRETQRKNLSILPLVIDIHYPSAGQGTCNQIITPAIKRISCNLVMALSLVHHLVFEQLHTFEQISDAFASFSHRWLLVEFSFYEDQQERKRCLDQRPWYTIENFIDALSYNFCHINVISDNSQLNVLLLCEK